MRQVRIGDVAFSRVLCGTNAFWGHSHFSAARSAEYAGRFDDGAIARVMQQCLDLGVNTVESCANERIASILSGLRDKNEGPLHLVGSTRIDEMSTMNSHQEKLSFLIEKRAAVCVIHAQFVDRPRRGDSIGGLKELVDRIHAAGLLAGISTHRVATVRLCEAQGYGLDAYLFPLNLSGFVYPGYEGTETVAERIDVVQSTATPFVLIKALGAGRIPPDEGLQFVGEHAKPDDLVSIGFGTEDEVSESLELAEKFL